MVNWPKDADETAKGQQDSLLDRPLTGLFRLDWEKGLYAIIVIVAVALRFWDLGDRILHHDESIHALWSWYIYTGRGYRHDPVNHGPFLYYAQPLINPFL